MDLSRTNFAAEVPQFERPVVASGNDSSIVQQEASRQHLPTVTSQGVLEETQIINLWKPWSETQHHNSVCTVNDSILRT